jgi:hypothetical protein
VDRAAALYARGKILTLTINGNSATFSGYVNLSGTDVTFEANVTDNSSGGTSDTMSLTLSNGYSSSGTVTTET